MQYKIQAVAPDTRKYTTKFGEMVSYKIKLEGVDTPVELSQKVTSPAPQAGDPLEGSIDTSGQYGPKFKKEYTPQGFGTGGSSTTTGSKPASKFDRGDNFTMYLSYAKDIAVALTASKAGYDKEQFDKILTDVAEGGEFLHKAHNEPTTNNDSKADEVMSDSQLSDAFNDVFGGDADVIDTDEVPFK